MRWSGWEGTLSQDKHAGNWAPPLRCLPTSQGHCEGRAEAQVSLYFPIAHHAELISSQVTYRYFPIEMNTTSTYTDAVWSAGPLYKPVNSFLVVCKYSVIIWWWYFISKSPTVRQWDKDNSVSKNQTITDHGGYLTRYVGHFLCWDAISGVERSGK